MSTANRDAVHASNRAFYDRIAHAYDFIADSNEHVAREMGERALALRPGEAVLEIGFGTGNTSIHLARAVGAGGMLRGIDISPKMLEVAQRKIAAEGRGASVELQVADARSLPYADGTFDAAFTSFTLELFPEADIPVVLAEALRVLKSGGRLGVVSMALVRPGERDSALESVYKWMHRHFPHLVDCRPIDPAAEMKQGGFQIASEERMEIWTMPVAAVVGRKPG